jgi:hypothetical protein
MNKEEFMRQREILESDDFHFFWDRLTPEVTGLSFDVLVSFNKNPGKHEQTPKLIVEINGTKYNVIASESPFVSHLPTSREEIGKWISVNLDNLKELWTEKIDSIDFRRKIVL